MFKMEKKVKAGELVLTEIAQKLALPSLYPKQCEVVEAGFVRLDGYRSLVQLHKLVVKADLPFLISKFERGRRKKGLP